MSQILSGKITGITEVSNSTDASNKSYVNLYASPSTTGQSGNFLSVYPGAAYWVLRTAGTTGSLNALTYANNTYVVAGDSGRLNTSTDAITWTLRTSGNTSTLRALTYAKNTYVVAGDSGILNTSTASGLSGSGGNGIKGGGGGGGSYDEKTNTITIGGNGGDGYVRISWY